MNRWTKKSQNERNHTHSSGREGGRTRASEHNDNRNQLAITQPNERHLILYIHFIIFSFRTPKVPESDI